MGKSVIREIFTEISRPRNPPLTPPKRGIMESPPKRGIICAFIKYVDLRQTRTTEVCQCLHKTRINKMKFPIQFIPCRKPGNRFILVGQTNTPRLKIASRSDIYLNEVSSLVWGYVLA